MSGTDGIERSYSATDRTGVSGLSFSPLIDEIIDA